MATQDRRSPTLHLLSGESRRRAERVRLLVGPLRPVLWWQAQALSWVLFLRLLFLLEPLLLKEIVDALASREPMGWVLGLTIGFGGLLVARGAVDILERQKVARAGYRVGLRVRQRLYEHVQRLCPSLAPSKGDLLFRLSDDVASVEQLFGSLVVQAVSVVLGLVGVVAGLFLMDARLAVLALLAAPVFVATTRRGRRRVREAAVAARERRSELLSFLEERLGALEAIQLGRRERHEARHLFRLGRSSVAAAMGEVRASAKLWGGVEIVTGATTGIVLALGVLAVSRGSLSIGSLLAFYMYVQQLFTSIEAGTGVAAGIERASASARRIADTLSRSGGVRGGPFRPAQPRRAVALRLEGVSFAYPGGAPVLSDLSLEVRAGEHVAIVGASGSGKTTLTRLLARFFDPGSGEVVLDGVDARLWNLDALRAVVALVPQTPGLLSGSLEANVSFGRSDPRMSPAAAAELAQMEPALIRALSERGVGSQGGNLSGGQRQRVALARLFCQDPGLIVLDEPTSSLDGATEERVWASVLAFARGRTLIAITHNPGVAARFPRVVVMDRGRIVRDGLSDDSLSLDTGAERARVRAEQMMTA